MVTTDTDLLAQATPVGASAGGRTPLRDASARLPIERFFTRPGPDGKVVTPTIGVEWDTRGAAILAEDGSIVFEQKDVEVPAFWSQTATNVVVSKYFRSRWAAVSSARRERYGARPPSASSSTAWWEP